MRYQEQYTPCDFCESIVDCLAFGRIEDCTGPMDTLRHYKPREGTECEKWEAEHE